jgi:DUF4097 and DUF4098 domain-containing protein YvlB
MRKRFGVLFVTTMLALAFAPRHTGATALGPLPSQDEDTVKDELDQTYQLSPGAHVEVSSINGPVEIETGSFSQAEVHIKRSAPTQADLDRVHVLIDHSASSLSVHEEKHRSESHIKTHVILRVPTQIDLSINGINGHVRAGDVEGTVNISGINGRVEIGQAVESSTISGINGAVSISLAKLGQQGLRLSGINGAIDLHFSQSLNANLEVSSINGGVYTDLPNVTVQGKLNARNFHAQLGSGGPVISLSSINGRVHISGMGNK